jgi:hypothetical protein
MLRWMLGFSLQFRAPIVEIRTEALGLAATEVEELITLHVEELLAAIRGTNQRH